MGEGKTSFRGLSHTRQTICFATLLLQGIEVIPLSETGLGGPNIETTLCLEKFPAKTSPHTLPMFDAIWILLWYWFGLNHIFRIGLDHFIL